MSRNQKVSTSGLVAFIFALYNVIVIKAAYIGDDRWYAAMFVPLLTLLIVDRKASAKRKQ